MQQQHTHCIEGGIFGGTKEKKKKKPASTHAHFPIMTKNAIAEETEKKTHIKHTHTHTQKKRVENDVHLASPYALLGSCRMQSIAHPNINKLDAGPEK